ncbi:CU044_5270 family protein [Streptomyces sp. NPDC048514]|uniref:CU044_5270 family protein n=1 Tax=Streptomyces sp. NPDC048514 TaxID=3365564 RepID=UPI00371E4581
MNVRRPSRPSAAEREEMTRLLPVPADRDLPAGRQRLLEDYFMQEIEQSAQSAPAAPRPHRRPLIRIAIATAVAAAVAVPVALGATGGTQTASAATVLNGAAQQDRTGARTIEPRGNQFIYTKEIVKEAPEGGGAAKTYVDENWTSVDGSKKGWTMELGHGWWNPPAEHKDSVWPPSDWATLKKLPTDPDKLLIAVRDWDYAKPDYNRPIKKQEWDAIYFGLAGLLYRVPVMPEGLRPAVFEALAQVPGVKTTENETDAQGREGIGISKPGDAWGHTTFVFDAKTYAYLGLHDTHASDDGKKKYDQRTYLSRYAVVDKVKQRP